MSKFSNEQKQKISESMKKAHAEGRAHNIGQSRWNNQPSYPEQWFMKVIAEEFNDKDYIREYPFYKYSLDFAWPNKKFCVEIDGAQHYRNNTEGLKQQERDAEKDKLLKDNGWHEIRIPWSTICLNTKDFITFVKNALDNLEQKDITKEPWYLIQHRKYYCPECGAEVTQQDNLCIKCAAKKQRKVNWPSKLDLAKEIYETNFTEVSKKYNVSANTIIKWCEFYNLPTHIFDLKNWYRVMILNIPEVMKKVKVNKLVIIQQIDTKTNEIIAEYKNYAEASEKSGITCDNISRVCRGLRKTAGGFKWKIIENKIDE